jgi:hypothetical protein
MKKHVVVLCALFSLFSAGCRKQTNAERPAPSTTKPVTGDDPKCLHIVNGITTNEFPSVVNLIKPTIDENGKLEAIGSCTGTFVSSSTLITASHCVDNSPNGGVGLNTKHLGKFPTTASDYQTLVKDLKRPVKVMRLVDVDVYPNLSRSDLAVVVFPKGTAPAISNLLLRTAKKGESAMIVGFGKSTGTDEKITTDPTLQKRLGYTTIREDPTSNFIWTRLSGGMIMTQGPNRPIAGQTDGQNATTGPGDSGGPLFINRSLAAVTQGGRSLGGTTDYAQYVDISSKAVMDFFQLVNTQGAKIPLNTAAQAAAAAELAPVTTPSTPSTTSPASVPATPSNQNNMPVENHNPC